MSVSSFVEVLRNQQLWLFAVEDCVFNFALHQCKLRGLDTQGAFGWLYQNEAARLTASARLPRACFRTSELPLLFPFAIPLLIFTNFFISPKFNLLFSLSEDEELRNTLGLGLVAAGVHTAPGLYHTPSLAQTAPLHRARVRSN